MRTGGINQLTNLGVQQIPRTNRKESELSLVCKKSKEKDKILTEAREKDCFQGSGRVTADVSISENKIKSQNTGECCFQYIERK